MNKTLAYVLGVVLVLALVAGAYYVGTNKAVAPTNERVAAPSWEISEVGEDETGAPLSEVSVTYAGETHAFGTQQGSCFEIAASAWELTPGEISGVICWWAGGGVEFGVFVEEGALVVKQGMLDEGTAEEEGMRGSFKTLLLLN